MDTQTLPQWTVSDRLVKARDFAGMTQDDVAASLGMSRRTVIRHEHSSSPPRWFVLAYAEITKVPADWLMGVDGPDLGGSPSACYGGGVNILPFGVQRAA